MVITIMGTRGKKRDLDNYGDTIMSGYLNFQYNEIAEMVDRPI